MMLRFLMSAALLVVPAMAVPDHDAEQMKPVVPAEVIPPSPVLGVAAALKSFELQPGFVIEPVAAEPLVDTPVCLDFDADGRMWICEMRGYMPDVDGKGEEIPAGRIVVLDDTNGDGRSDTRTVFLERLLLPRALAVYEDGLLFMDQQRLAWVPRKGVVATGEVQVVDADIAAGGNVEHKPNGLLPNLDNRLYLAKSDRRISRTATGWQLEATAFRGQWGIARDDFGRLYHNNNSTLLFGDLLAPNLLGKNPGKVRDFLQLGSNRVWPARVTPAVNRAYMARANGFDSDTLDPRTHKLISATAAAGMTLYRGSNFPREWYGTAFTGETVGNLVKAIRISSKNGAPKGSHPTGDREFLASTDERFRPVNLYNAPDGSLYLVDMYHGIIQHKTYMTPYLREQTLSRGLDQPAFGLGRIYRIRSKSGKLETQTRLGSLDDRKLVDLLKHPNAWQRETAQRLLVSRKNPATVAPLASLAAAGTSLARIHAIWTLEGIGALEPVHLRSALGSGDPELQSSALWAATRLSTAELSKLAREIVAIRPAGEQVRPYLARALGALATPDADRKLISLISNDDLVSAAAVAGLAGREAEFLAKLKGGKSLATAQLLQRALKNRRPRGDRAISMAGADRASFERGKTLFHGQAACFGCHGPDGAGMPNLGPPLDGSEWVTGEPTRLAKVLLHGLSGPIQVSGKAYRPGVEMPGLAGHSAVDDQAIADIATYIRNAWTNRAPVVPAKLISQQRETHRGHAGRPWTAAELEAR